MLMSDKKETGIFSTNTIKLPKIEMAHYLQYPGKKTGSSISTCGEDVDNLPSQCNRIRVILRYRMQEVVLEAVALGVSKIVIKVLIDNPVSKLMNALTSFTKFLPANQPIQLQ